MPFRNKSLFSRYLAALLLMACTPGLTSAAEPVQITQLFLAQDRSAELGPEDVAAGRIDFSQVTVQRQSLGSSDSAFWLKLQIENTGTDSAWRWLEVGQARLNEITLYEKQDGDWKARQGGTSQPFSMREIPTLTQTFSVDMAPHASKELLVRVASDTVMIIHPRLWTTGELLRAENHNTQLEFFMAGAVVLMLLFGVVMWGMLREPGFLVFGLVSLCFLMFRWSIKGIAFREFWPDSPQWALPAIGFFWALVGMLILILHRILLKTPRHFPVIDRLIVFAAISFALFAIGFFILPHRPLMHTMSIWGLLTISLFSPVLGYMAWRKGVVLGGYLFASYVLPWQVTQWLYFASLGWLPRLPAAFTDHAMAGSTLAASVIILAGLAARMVQAQREKVETERQQRAILESQVRERTQELHKAKDIAENALDEHRQFLAMISHELRSPVASVSSASELLEAHAQQKADLPIEVIQRIRRAVRRMAGFMDNLLADDRLGAEGWYINRVAVSPVRLLTDILEQARQSAPKHNLILEVGQFTQQITLDPVLIRIMLLNLLDNAVKYSEPGTQVTLKAQMNDQDQLVLEVIDQGQGMDPREAPLLFEKYVRGQQTGTVPGTGMGLYIVRRVAELHEGEASVSVLPGEGTVFRVTLSAGNDSGGENIVP